MAMFTNITDNFTFFKPSERKPVKLQYPLMDEPIDLDNLGLSVSESGNLVPVQEQQKTTNNDTFKAYDSGITRTYDMNTTERTLKQSSSSSNKNNTTAINIMDKLIERGMKPHEAAAVVGHMSAESGLNSSKVNNNDLGAKSGGLGQWRGERLTFLKKYAQQQGKPWTDIDLQADYIIHELQNNEKSVLNRLSNTTTPTEASKAWSYYERFAGYDGTTATAKKAGWSQSRINQEHEKRERNSEEYYKMWKLAHQA